MTQRDQGLGWEGTLQRAREAGGRAGVGPSGCRTHTHTYVHILHAALRDRCANIWDRRWSPSLHSPFRSAHHWEPEVVMRGVCVRGRALAHPGLPESAPEYIIYRGHSQGARVCARTHRHIYIYTHIPSKPHTYIIYAAFRFVGGNLISIQAGNSELREDRMRGPEIFPRTNLHPCFSSCLQLPVGPVTAEKEPERLGFESQRLPPPQTLKRQQK